MPYRLENDRNEWPDQIRPKTAGALERLQEIADTAARAGVSDRRQVAYLLATVRQEVGPIYEPVRERFAKSDQEARRLLAGKPYAEPDPETGHAYYGRGYVQLTWRKNYAFAAEALGIDLVNEPDLALDHHTAAAILVRGVTEGWFHPEQMPLRTAFRPNREPDLYAARRNVNLHDRWARVADFYHQFLPLLHDASQHQEDPPMLIKLGLSLLRHLLTFGGGAIVSKGIADAATVEQITGALIAIAGLVASQLKATKEVS